MLILVIYWKKTGLLHTKISNRNIIYSSQKPRKSSSLPLKSSSWLLSLDAFKFGNNTYPWHIRRRSNLGNFLGKKCVLWAGKYAINSINHQINNVYIIYSVSGFFYHLMHLKSSCISQIRLICSCPECIITNIHRHISESDYRFYASICNKF